MWAFVISAAVLLLAALAVAYPLLFQRLEPMREALSTEAIFNERAALLEAISELELEYGAGKLSETDYKRHKARYQRQYLNLVDGAEANGATRGSAAEEPPAATAIAKAGPAGTARTGDEAM